jgi:hypothetical protein
MTTTTQVINVAQDFYDAPVGRYPADGKYNGERFRNEILVPHLNNDGDILIDLDGTDGYGSSFLDEAFGGLVRLCGYTSQELHKRLTFKSEEDESFIGEIWDYIDTAKSETNKK